MYMLQTFLIFTNNLKLCVFVSQNCAVHFSLKASYHHALVLVSYHPIFFLDGSPTKGYLW